MGKLSTERSFVKLRDLVQVRKEHGELDVKSYIEIGDIDIDTKQYFIKAKKSIKGCKKSRFQDVIVSRVRPTRGAISIIKENEIEISSAFTVLKSKPNIDSKYLFYSLAYNKDFFRYLEKLQKGTSYPSCREQDILNFIIHVPEMSIQKKIVSILEKVENAKKIRNEADELTTDFLKAVFLDMFGNGDKYPIKELKELIKEFKFGSSTKSGSEGYSILGIPNVIGDELKLENCNNVKFSQKEFENFKLKKDDILFVRTNGNPNYIGRCGVFQLKNNDKYVFASYLIRARVKSDLLEPLFLKTFLELPIGRKYMLSKCRTTAGQYNINTQGLGSLKIPLVPIKLQKKFVLFFNQIIHLKDHQKQSEKHIDDFFNVLTQKAFKGELTC